MHRFWDAVIEPVLELLGPEKILEIGSDRGPNTRKLLAFCGRKGGTLHVIDPLPKYDVPEWKNTYGDKLVFHQSLSLDALPGIDGFDAVLIDGDHNWYTVYNELKSIEKRCEELSRGFPLVMMHDVGWPYGRRDLYYDPDGVPEEYRQPYERKGIQMGLSELSATGGLNPHLCNAIHEGGPRNGVLTAVEDFIAESDISFDLLVVRTFHGLGVLATEDLRTRNKDLDGFLNKLPALQEELSVEGELLDLTEKERLRMTVQLQQKNSELREAMALHEPGTGHYEEELRETRQELEETRRREDETTRRLKHRREDVRTLVRWIEELNKSFAALLSSRQWKVGRAFGEVWSRFTSKPGSLPAAGRMTEIFGEFRGWRQGRRTKKTPDR